MSTPTPLASCSCCGEPLADERRIDIRFGLPDAALGAPEEARRTFGADALLRVDGVGFFVRALLPLKLSGDTKLVLGAWLEVDEEMLRHAAAVWYDEAAYPGLAVRGRLANAVEPWGAEVLGLEVTGRISDPGELPYLVEGHEPMAVRLLGDVWDRDHVLSRFPSPLPVAVRTDLDDGWSVERSAGLSARFVDGVDQFAGPDRSVAAALFQDDPAGGRTAEDFLRTELLAGAPEAPDAQWSTERLPDGGVRHAFWFTPEDTGRGRHEFYAYAVEADGSAAGLYCSHESAEAHAWARHVWGSLRREAGATPVV
ncbi:hypothetical protein AQF52_4603 [Streptomyces venezuelae]|uniref:DUF2199 domain-containing protein n=1 Tax=Streptomyces gardneri TaxID=66892 RepID=UPI0006BD61B2|nr:DUF2199 domain-containing protein [Streptomyces gardneri]ALO10197.1 hypothetical protein AQF52_4603 [Streptomyces venezuelae]QPK47222.1 DUF2199 domain-containing protein [Streptomyces gardneri]WRK38645.1 DUF2199 domain-containing protein [Streptomyces venezuelae]CUM39350.1 hypothetical protein BN2537_7665 [Streptomyces venezuelae]